MVLLSGRYRLSRREVQQLLQDLWQVKLSLGAVVHQEQAQTAALASAELVHRLDARSRLSILVCEAPE